jgi:hypothetical protein
MSKPLKVSDEVYEALQIIKVYPSTAFNDVIKGLIDQVFPGVFFDDTDKIDRQLFREAYIDDNPPDELRQVVKMIKERRKQDETKDLD